MSRGAGWKWVCSLFHPDTDMSGLSATERLVLINLATWAAKSGVVFRSAAQVSAATSVPRRSVFRALDGLRSAGWLVEVGAGPRRAKAYQLVAKTTEHTIGDEMTPSDQLDGDEMTPSTEHTIGDEVSPLNIRSVTRRHPDGDETSPSIYKEKEGDLIISVKENKRAKSRPKKQTVETRLASLAEVNRDDTEQLLRGLTDALCQHRGKIVRLTRTSCNQMAPLYLAMREAGMSLDEACQGMSDVFLAIRESPAVIFSHHSREENRPVNERSGYYKRLGHCCRLQAPSKTGASWEERLSEARAYVRSLEEGEVLPEAAVRSRPLSYLEQLEAIANGVVANA